MVNKKRQPNTISLNAARKLLARVAVDKDLQIGRDAVEEMVYILEDDAHLIGEVACENARHAGRRTLRREDLRLAVNQ